MEQNDTMSKNYMPISQHCARCSKYGNFVCERCDETYCSRVCQVQDWREHRRICAPIPRLVARSEQASVYPFNRMLMDVNGASFDATDAIGSISENSMHGESLMDQEQVVKITNTLNKMHIDAKIMEHKTDIKSNKLEILEVMSTPPSTPKKTPNINNSKTVDENANYNVTPAPKVTEKPKVSELPKQRVLTPPPEKKQPVYKPSMNVIEPRMKVFIVHVANHNTVFVAPYSEAKQWEDLLKNTNKHASMAQALKNPPEIGYIVLAKPKNCSEYGRCLVKKIRIQEKIAKVEFLEYGFTDIIHFEDMKCLSEELVNAPRLVNMVTLIGVSDDMEHAQEVERFLMNLQETRAELIVGDLQPVEITANFAQFNATLVDGAKFHVINDMLKSMVAVQVEEKIEIDDVPDEPPRKSNHNDIEYIGFSGENVNLYILDNSFLHIGCFSGIQVKDMALLGKNDELINKNPNALQSGLPFHPRDNELCLAQSMEDNRWYRATSQGRTDENTYQLMYIDYGNMETVSTDRIREISEEYAFPCITMLCFLEGLGENISDKVVRRLKEKIPQYSEVNFDSIKHTGEESVCTSNKIMKALKEEGLI